jgi:hypothetical protein
MDSRCPVVVCQYSIHSRRMPLARSRSSWLGRCPCSTTTTMPVLNFLCEWSTSGKRSPSAAITSWIVTFVRSALNTGCPFVSLPVRTRFFKRKKSGTYAAEINPIKARKFRTAIGIPVQGPALYAVLGTLGREVKRVPFEAEYVDLPQHAVVQFQYDQVSVDRDLTDRMAGLGVLLPV